MPYPQLLGRRGDSGFTLMELLVALTLLALLMTVMLGGLRLGTHVWETSNTHIESGDEVSVVRNFLRQRLEEALPVSAAGRNRTNRPHFVGEPERLQLTSSMPASLGEGLFQLQLAVNPASEDDKAGRLILDWRAWPEAASGDNSQRMILDDVAGIAFAYYTNGTRREEGRWVRTWQDQDLLPELIRVDLFFPPDDTRDWQPLIVSPMVDDWFDAGL